MEYSFFLKYLFKCSYHIEENAEEKKVIPDNFRNSEEYETIFEYLFLNESYA